MGDWYTIGLALGLGTALGVLFAGLLSSTPLGRISAIVLGGAAGAVVGFVIDDWTEIVAGAVGGVVGAAAAVVVVAGALRRGGTRGGLALIVAAVAAGLAGLAFVPAPASSRRSRCRSSPCASVALRPTGTPACAALPATKKLILILIDGLTPSMLEDTLERGAAPVAGAARRARPLPPRDLDLPVADAGVPLGARDRGASRRARDPAPRLVPPRRAAAGRVRLVVRRRPCGRDEAVADRHGLRPQREPPRQRRRDRLRGARGRGPDRSRDQHHLLPRPSRAPADRALPDASGVRPEPLLLLQPLRVRRDRRAALRAQPARAAPSTPMRRRSGGGSSRATASTSSSSISPTTTTPRTHRARTRRTQPSRAATTPSAR